MSPPYVNGRRLLALSTCAAAAALAVGAPAMAAPATGQILRAGGSTAIAGSYIVVLKSNAVSTSGGQARVASAVSDKAGSLASKYSGKVARVYSAAVRGFEARVSAQQAARLATDPAVAYVEQNHRVSISGTQTNPPWGLDRIDQANLPLDSSYTYPNTGSSVHAYIIDTGILTTHNQFGGRASSGYDFVDNDSNATDCNGHGTHVAGTVGGSTYGVAKSVSLVAVRVLDCDGYGTDAGVIDGVDWVTANAVKPAVANMSLGGDASTTLDNAVSSSISAGITYGIAAGNGDDNGNALNACNESPARVSTAITVSATNSSDAKASWANYGSCVDIFAPGVSITSAWYSSTSATNTISGTSMATPHVVGAAALVLNDNPSYTPAQVASALTSAATTGVVTSPGSNSPNRLLRVGSGGSTPATCTGTNGTDVSIPDAGSAVTSSITISGCGRSASSSSTVAVNIVHTYRGDLVVSLVAPDGSTYTLKNSSGSDSADNVNTTYTVNLSSEAADGTWKLKVQDVYSQDTGYINTWTLTV